MSFFVHPDIGKVTGKRSDCVTQFLGIKYATLENRFAVSQLVAYSGDGIDATNHGPQVPSPPMGVDFEFSFIQNTLAKPDFPGVSEVDGLSLNITVPGDASDIKKGNGLPVLVFIHGGGYSIGGNWWPQYDAARLVQLSHNLGKPIVAVNINYRVGAPGFLTSPELRKAGFKPNNGIRDQRVALRWIQKYITGFGGDAGDVTVAGESAGGVSTGLLLLEKEPLAKRLITLGGAPPLLAPLPTEIADDTAQNVSKLLGLDGTPSSDLAQRLLDVPLEDLWTKLPPSLPLHPVVDDDIIPHPINFSALKTMDKLAGTRHIESILVGESKLDGSIMAYSGLLERKKGIAAAFRDSAAKTLAGHPATLASLLDHYSLAEKAGSKISDDEALFNIVQFITDIAFFTPAVEIAANFPRSAYLFAFNEPNPWDGLFKGHASHILDVAFLFQNFNEKLDEAQRSSAVALGTDVITFVNGEAPWKAFNSGQSGVAVYSQGKRGYHEPPNAEDIERSTFILDWANAKGGPGQDKLMDVFTNFHQG